MIAAFDAEPRRRLSGNAALATSAPDASPHTPYTTARRAASISYSADTVPHVFLSHDSPADVIQ
jgi:hypothetical protein